MRGSDTSGIIRQIFSCFLRNYQEELKIIKGSNLVFESVELIDYKLHRVRLRKGGSYVKSPEWLVNKKAKINPKKNDNECLWWSTIYLYLFTYSACGLLTKNKERMLKFKEISLSPMRAIFTKMSLIKPAFSTIWFMGILKI